MRKTSTSVHMINALDNPRLMELLSQGLKYTWSIGRDDDSIIGAKLDRGVANVDWWDLFPNADVKILPNVSFDHSPVILNSNDGSSFLRRPFRFEVVWTQDKRSHWVVDHAWAQANHYQNCVNTSEIHLLDRVLRYQLEELLQCEELMWFQKAKLNWQVEGNRCSRFFFMTTMVKRKTNRIDCLKLDNGDWIYSKSQIGNFFTTRFESIFDSPMASASDMSWLIDLVISDEENNDLLHIPNWDEDFFITSTMTSSINMNIIVLIPKKPNPSCPNHFRSISVCNVTYGVISKILANRLKPMLDRLICPT
ncbi:hypothetical protein UlMin_015815 [Ulmus minor]